MSGEGCFRLETSLVKKGNDSVLHYIVERFRPDQFFVEG